MIFNPLPAVIRFSQCCLGVSLSLLLLGCASGSLDTPPSSNASSTASPPESIVQETSEMRAQMLPITAEAEMNGQIIQLEVALTPQQQATGLMFRTELADNRGMLFLFERPRPAQFWMQNTLIPLDMVFMLNGEVKAIAANARPCTADPCPLYESGVPVNEIIELRGGRAAELGLRVGDRVVIRPFAQETTPAPTP